MSYKMTASEIDVFCSKLEKFSTGLSDTERTLFKSLLNADGLSDHALDLVRGGIGDQLLEFRNFAPTLDASYFRTLSW
jgi:hypothetical protein